jgi:hypothetical protein
MEDAMTLPEPPDLHGLLIRTDYSDDAAWAAVRGLLSQPDDEGFTASLTYVEGAAYDGLTPEALRAMAAEGPDITYVVVADRVTMTDPEHSLLLIDVYDYDEDEDESDEDDEDDEDDLDADPDDGPAPTFRAVPDRIATITANLEIANMDFEEFADSVDGDGVFRGFG